MKKRIGVLLSGRGPNFVALAESVAAGRIPNAEISIVISNREGAPGIDKAKTLGIETRVILSKGLQREDSRISRTSIDGLPRGEYIVRGRSFPGGPNPQSIVRRLLWKS